MKYNLFLDDIRFPYINPDNYTGLDKNNIETFISAWHYSKFEPFKTEEWIIVRTHDDFIEYVEKYGVPELVAFDHDLGDEHYPINKQSKNDKEIDYSLFIEKTGYDSAKWLCHYCEINNVKFPNYYVHSWNKVGVKNITTYIENYKKHIENER